MFATSLTMATRSPCPRLLLLLPLLLPLLPRRPLVLTWLHRLRKPSPAQSSLPNSPAGRHWRSKMCRRHAGRQRGLRLLRSVGLLHGRSLSQQRALAHSQLLRKKVRGDTPGATALPQSCEPFDC